MKMLFFVATALEVEEERRARLAAMVRGERTEPPRYAICVRDEAGRELARSVSAGDCVLEELERVVRAVEPSAFEGASLALSDAKLVWVTRHSVTTLYEGEAVTGRVLTGLADPREVVRAVVSEWRALDEASRFARSPLAVEGLVLERLGLASRFDAREAARRRRVAEDLEFLERTGASVLDVESMY